MKIQISDTFKIYDNNILIEYGRIINWLHTYSIVEAREKLLTSTFEHFKIDIRCTGIVIYSKPDYNVAIKVEHRDLHKK